MVPKPVVARARLIPCGKTRFRTWRNASGSPSGTATSPMGQAVEQAEARNGDADDADTAQAPGFLDPDAEGRSDRQPAVGADAAPGDDAGGVFLADVGRCPSSEAPVASQLSPKPRIRRLVRISPRHARGRRFRKPERKRQMPEQPQATRPERTVRRAPTWSAILPAWGRLSTVATYWALIARPARMVLKCELQMDHAGQHCHGQPDSEIAEENLQRGWENPQGDGSRGGASQRDCVERGHLL